jgi:hypothetical protein
MRLKPVFLWPEIALALAAIVLVAIACLAPAVAQSAGHHAFVDTRSWLGIPNAADVLSNLPFAVFGLAGWLVVDRVPKLQLFGAPRRLARLFFAGLLLTAAASGWYHWHPDNAGLVADRCGMAVAFAGLLGLAIADRISDRAGWTAALVLLALGPVSVMVWAGTGNVLPWALLQGGGMLLLVVLTFVAPHPAALGVRICAVIGLYAVAKLLELGDHVIFDVSGGLVSGHTLKHLVAALAAWPVLSAVLAAQRAGHNLAERKRRGQAEAAPARPA